MCDIGSKTLLVLFQRPNYEECRNVRRLSAWEKTSLDCSVVLISRRGDRVAPWSGTQTLLGTPAFIEGSSSSRATESVNEECGFLPTMSHSASDFRDTRRHGCPFLKEILNRGIPPEGTNIAIE